MAPGASCPHGDEPRASTPAERRERGWFLRREVREPARSETACPRWNPRVLFARAKISRRQ